MGPLKGESKIQHKCKVAMRNLYIIQQKILILLEFVKIIVFYLFLG